MRFLHPRHPESAPRYPTAGLRAPPPSPASRSTERLLDALVRLRWLGVGHEGGLVLIGLGQNRQKFLERGKVVPLHRSLDERFDPMVAGDVGRVDGAHRRLARCTLLWLLAKPFPPPHGPPVIGCGIDEQVADGPVMVRTSRRIA